MIAAYYKIVRFLFAYGSENAISKTLLFLAALACNVCSALMEGIAYYFMIGALSALVGQKMEWMAWLFQGAPSFSLLIGCGFGAQILKSTLGLAGSLANARLCELFQSGVQQHIYQKILKMEFASFNQYKMGELVDYAVMPALYLRGLMEGLYQFFASVALVAVSALVLLLLSWQLTAVVFTSIGIVLLIQRFFLKKVFSISSKMAKKLEELSSDTVQNLGGMRLIHLYSHNDLFLDKIIAAVKKGAHYARRLILLSAVQIALHEIAGILLVGSALFFGSLLLHGENALPILLGFMAITYRMSSRVQAAAQWMNEIARMQGFVSQLLTFLQRQDPLLSPAGKKPPPHFQTMISIQDLSFHYPRTEKSVIQEFSYRIPKGAVVAVVGKSGAGKSTFLDLIAGLYTPSSGTIRIDGDELSHHDLAAWRSKIGVVSQDTFIFNDTIEMNIRLGNRDAPFEEVERAAQNAFAAEFICRLPCGYKTLVGERGHRLSGGERQRISLARALIRDPEILILDEATSHLDAHNEKLIQKTFAQYKGKKTVLVVAHRLSTVMHADTILFLEKGKILESGTHEELLKKNGRYASFWHMQFKIKA